MFGSRTLVLLALSSLGVVAARIPDREALAVADVVAEPAAHAPAPWLAEDPADSIYRAARQALNRGRWREAASLFAQIGECCPKSGYAADALYWQAFALYRLGGSDALRTARAALDRQAKKYPSAATHGDAATLATRIDAALAQGGDANAAESVTQLATEAGEVPVPPRAPHAPKPPRAPRAPRGLGSHDRCDDQDDLQMAALNGLLQMDPERAVPILRKVLARRDEGSACLRRKAVFLVSQKQTPETEDILLSTARTDPDPDVREQAVFWLSQVGSDRAVTALDSIARRSNDPGLQGKAIFALSQQSSPRALQALRDLAEREDVPEENRANAIFWLGQRSGDEGATFLRTLYPRLKNPELKEKVLFSVSQQGGPAAAKWLLDIAKSPSEPIEMRKKALFWAGQSRSVSAEDLGAIYNTVNDREVKEQIIFGLSQRNDKAAVDRLIDIAKREQDRELRKKALFWLGQSNDPRVADVLGEILEGK